MLTKKDDTISKMNVIEMKYQSQGRENMIAYKKNICFVCGSTGITGTLYIKPRSKGAYFPFLEQHEAPKGASPPTQEGGVQACNICFAFLQQQWESFERNKTPAIKRLYWLKRCDNGTFTGAEMHIQGEYVSQMLGLQYVPGTYSCGDHTPIDGGNTLSPTSVPNVVQTRKSVPPPPPPKGKSIEMNTSGVLDLSVQTTSKGKDDNSQSPKRLSHGGSSTIYCFLCDIKQPEGLMRFIYTKKNNVDEPFFTFLESIAQKRGVTMTSAGLTRVCSNCRKTLHRQWRGFEVSNTPEEMRIYHINDKPVNLDHIKQTTRKDTSNVSRNIIQQENRYVCYVCTKEYPRDQLDYIHSKAFSKSRREIYFPFISLLQKPEGAKAMDANGCVLACVLCRESLNKQWSMYDSQNVPEEFRQYYLTPYPDMMRQPQVTGVNSHIQQPLNISISAAGSTPTSQIKDQGLLAIAAAAEKQSVKSPPSTPISDVHIKEEPVEDDSGDLFIDVEEEDSPDNNSVERGLNRGRDSVEGTPMRPYNLTIPSVNMTAVHGPSGTALSPVSPASEEYGKDISNQSRGRPSSCGSSSSGSNNNVISDPSKHLDCDITPGLPQGPKPPPLSMLSPPSTKVSRTTATVQPLTTESPVSSSTAINASRQSSFAAALRKLAKQATDLPEGSQATKLGDGSFDSSPGSSSSARTPTPKRAQPPGSYSGHTTGGQGHSPPVVTIAPTQSYSTIAASDGRKSVDRPGTASSASGSVITEPVSIKQERDRNMQPLSLDRRDDDRPISKDGNMSSHSTPKVITPGVLPGGSALVRDEGPGRGFQPYRAGDEVRAPYPSAYPSMDPALYPYHAAAAAAYMTPHGFPHPAFRFDDPLIMERYRMMQGTSPFFPYTHPGMLPPAGLGLGYPTLSGYPPELLRQHHSMVSPSSKTQDLRSPAQIDRSEEERRERNREAEREKRRESERHERHEQEREKRRKEAEREHLSKHSHNGPVHPQAHKSSSSHSQPHSNSHYPHSSMMDKHKMHEMHERHREKDIHHHSHSQHRSDSHSRDSPRRSESHSQMGHPPPLVSNKPHTSTNHVKEPLKSFHRPFESSVVNGIDRNHWLGQQESQIAKHTVRDLSVKKEQLPQVHDGKVQSERVESSQIDDLHYMKQYKRLKLLNDVKQEAGNPSYSPVSEPKHIKSEELNREPDYKYKAQFLFFLGLHVVPPERRKEMLVIHDACEKDRLKRLNNYNAEKQVLNLSVHRPTPHGEMAEPTPLSLKRKLHERESSDTPPPKRSVKSLLQSNHAELKVPTPPHRTYLAAPSSHTTANNRDVPATDSKPDLFQQTKEKCRDFAQEFHKSVLLSTRQQELTARIGPPRSSSSPQRQPSNRGQRLPERHPVSSSSSGGSTGKVDNSEVFKWPGIEVLLEAYQRHVEEQNVEKDVIQEECKKLRKQNQELNQSAEALSRTMSELLQNKQLLEQERIKSESAIETLVKYVRGLR